MSSPCVRRVSGSPRTANDELPEALSRGAQTLPPPAYKGCDLREAGAAFRMPVHPIVEAAHYPAAEQLLLTIGRAGVLSSRVITVEGLEKLQRLLGPPSERQRTDLKRATDIVLMTGEQFQIRDAVHVMARVQATLT